MSSSSPVLAEKSKLKKKRREKDKGKSREKIVEQVIPSRHGEDHGKNEGVDPNWAYQPPDGMVVLDTSNVDEAFDWDLLKDDEDKELWIVRIPEGFKPKLLDGLEIQQPLKAPGAKLSTLERKRAKYDIWSVEQLSKEKPTGGDERPPRGEEVQNLSCLLPRMKKEGKFYLAPKPISQHIIVTHPPAMPNVDNGAVSTPSTRYSVPKHLLKHQFVPFGASSSTDGIRRPTSAVDVDVPMKSQEEIDDNAKNLLQTAVLERTPKKKISQSPEKAGTKRKKAEGESVKPKHKAKKLKV